MIDIAILKSQANGRWLEILANIGGLQSEFLHFDNREGPCPRCGGNTRFRGLDEETGASSVHTVSTRRMATAFRRWNG